MAAALTTDCALPSSAFQSKKSLHISSQWQLPNQPSAPCLAPPSLAPSSRTRAGARCPIRKEFRHFRPMAAALTTDCALPSSAFQSKKSLHISSQWQLPNQPSAPCLAPPSLAPSFRPRVGAHCPIRKEFRHFRPMAAAQTTDCALPSSAIQSEKSLQISNQWQLP
jgi:hypothetical protein